MAGEQPVALVRAARSPGGRARCGRSASPRSAGAAAARRRAAAAAGATSRLQRVMLSRGSRPCGSARIDGSLGLDLPVVAVDQLGGDAQVAAAASDRAAWRRAAGRTPTPAPGCPASPVGLVLVEQLVAPGVDLAAVLDHDRPQQTLAVAEVVLQRRRVALLRLAVDLPQRHAVDAAAGEQLLGRGDQRRRRVRGRARRALSAIAATIPATAARLRPSAAPDRSTDRQLASGRWRFRDRFWTPTTAKAIALVADPARRRGRRRRRRRSACPSLGAVAIGVAVYAGAVARSAMPRRPSRRPSTRSPSASRGGTSCRAASARSGAHRDRPRDAARPAPRPAAGHRRPPRRRAARGLGSRQARRPDRRRRPRTSTRPACARAWTRCSAQAAEPRRRDNLAAAIASVESQLASADRLKQLSATTADQLRLTQSRLDELVARAAEVSVGAGDTDRFAHDVDDLVLELEGLHQAVQELPG